MTVEQLDVFTAVVFQLYNSAVSCHACMMSVGHEKSCIGKIRHMQAHRDMYNILFYIYSCRL